MYDIERLKDDLTMSDVCAYYGVNIDKRGRTAYIPCPSHYEKKHDNCVISKSGKGFCCFSCGEKGDVIDYIKIMSNATFLQAVEIGASILGDTDGYHLTETKPLVPVISQDECDFLGIVVKPVYALKEITDDAGTLLENDEEMRPCDNYQYAVMKQKVRNPLRTLKENNREAYNELIMNKAQEKINILNEIKKALPLADIQVPLERAIRLFIEHGGVYEKKPSFIISDSMPEASGSALF